MHNGNHKSVVWSKWIKTYFFLKKETFSTVGSLLKRLVDLCHRKYGGIFLKIKKFRKNKELNSTVVNQTWSSFYVC